MYDSLSSGLLPDCLISSSRIYGYGLVLNSFLSLGGFLPPPCSFFDTLEGFSYYAMDCFLWYPLIYFYRLNTLWNIATVYPMVLSSLWNLTVSVLLYSRTSFLSWTMLFSTTVYYTWEFKRLDTSGNLSEKLADNEVGQMGTRYSSTAL